MNLNERHADFFERVFDIVQLIPIGRVTSFGAIAKALGTPSSSRMVGWAMNASHTREGIPAHRVVNRNGLLTGKMHFSDPNEMENRLKAEGVEVHKDKVTHFEELFWNPLTEIEL